jgi:hypothetical protein
MLFLASPVRGKTTSHFKHYILKIGNYHKLGADLQSQTDKINGMIIIAELNNTVEAS